MLIFTGTLPHSLPLGTVHSRFQSHLMVPELCLRSAHSSGMMMMMLLLSMLSVAEMDPQTSIRINVATVAFTSAALAHWGVGWRPRSQWTCTREMTLLLCRFSGAQNEPNKGTSSSRGCRLCNVPNLHRHKRIV